MVLYPVSSSFRARFVTHNFVTHILSHQLCHTHTQPCTHTIFRTQLSRTTLSHTIFHAHLCHAHTIFHAQLCHIIFHTQLCHTHNLAHTHTQSFTHNFVTHTILHTHTQFSHAQSFTHTQPSHTHNFVKHNLSHTTFHTQSFTHTTLSHTIFHIQSFTRNLCHTPSFTHNLVTQSFTQLLCHTQRRTSPLVARGAAPLCRAGAARAHTNLRFARQAWRLLTSAFVLRGRRGACSH